MQKLASLSLSSLLLTAVVGVQAQTYGTTAPTAVPPRSASTIQALPPIAAPTGGEVFPLDQGSGASAVTGNMTLNALAAFVSGHLGYTPARLGSNYSALLATQRPLGEHGLLATAFAVDPSASGFNPSTSITPDKLCNSTLLPNGAAQDDSIVINAAVDAANANGGNDVFLPKGTCRLANPIHKLTNGTRLWCESPYTTILTPTAAMAAMVSLSGPQAGVKQCGFQDASNGAGGYLAQVGVDVNKAHDELFSVVEQNFFTAFPIAMRHSGGSTALYDRNIVLGNGKYDATESALVFTSDGTDSIVSHNVFQGTAGVIQHAATGNGAQTSEGLTFEDNRSLGADGPSLLLDGCLDCRGSLNLWNGYITHPMSTYFAGGSTSAYMPAVYITSTAATTKNLSFTGDQVGSAAYTNTSSSPVPVGTCAMTLNTTISATLVGLSFAAASNVNNLCLTNTNNATRVYGMMTDQQATSAIDIFTDGTSANLMISGAFFTGAKPIVAGADTGLVQASSFSGGVPPSISGTGLVVGRQATGLVTQNTVNVVFAAGSSTQKDVLVTHGLWTTPALISATLNASAGGNNPSIYFDGCNATTCAAHLAAPVSSGSLNFNITFDALGRQ